MADWLGVQVPVLEFQVRRGSGPVRTQQLAQSLPIVEFLDEVIPGRGPPLLPADPLQRALVRQVLWAKLGSTKMRSEAWVAT